MDVIQVEGGHRVTGEVRVEGAKNSALKLMAATIMAPGVTTLKNVPNIADVHVMGKVLKNIGAQIEVVNEHELKIDTSTVDSWETPYHLVAQMRASTAVLGPLLSRFGRAIVAMPGGCNIGARSIDMHILGLEALGDGVVRIRRTPEDGGGEFDVVVSGGYAEIDREGVIILADHARRTDDIDVETVRRTRDKALDALDEMEEGDYRAAYYEKKVRWCNLLLKQATGESAPSTR